MFRHVSTGITAGLLSIALLTGCSTDDASQQEDDPSAGATTTAGTTAPSTTEAPAESEPPSVEPTEGESSTPSTEPSPEPTTTGDVADLASVTPFITYAGPAASGSSIEVSGFVPDLVESGGTCTAHLTLLDGKATVTESSTTEVGAESTTCVSILVSSAELTAGTWRATLSYASQTSAGTSAPVDVEVG